MPRKRTTRIKPAPKQLTANIPLAQDVSDSDKNEQLKVFLQEFDVKVKNTLSEMEAKRKMLIKLVRAKFEEQIVQLPESIANMTLKEFAEAGGTIQAAEEKLHASKLQRLGELKHFGVRETLKVEESGLSIINEEETEESALAKSTIPKLKGKTRKGATARQTRSKFHTPCGTTSRSTWGQTPLITPKFNPFLPLTPENERESKPGERLMSLAGSPVRPLGKASIQTTETIQRLNKIEVAEDLADMGIDVTPGRAVKLLEYMSTKLVNN